MTTMTVRAERIELALDADEGRIHSLLNRATGESLIAARGARQSLTLRTPLEPSESIVLSRLARARADEATGGIELEYRDRSEGYRALLAMTPCDDGLRFTLTAQGERPLWLAEWTCAGLELSRVLVPALGGQALERSMPEGAALSYKYPFWWSAQSAIGQTPKGACMLSSHETRPRLKLLRVKKESGAFALTYGVEAQAPLRSRRLEGEWFLDAYQGSWRVPALQHRAWMERAFGLTPLAKNARVPAWMDKINFVLELWGAAKGTEAPRHTFDQMVERMRAWKKFHAPEETLVYLPGFAEHGVDSHAPDYHPSAECGGAAQFRRMVEAAHAMGYHVMAHTNVLAMTFSHPLYPKFKRHQVTDCFGRKQTWGLDMDGDWLAEPYFAYINPGARAWSELMTGVIGELVNTHGVDAIFLDQTLLAFNVKQGPNFLKGMREHIGRLACAFPTVLFAGEGLHEHVASALPMAQIHGIDSLSEVHGMEGRKRWRKAHPISMFLFSPYTRFAAHLLTKHPSHPAFGAQEKAYAMLGVLPALSLYDHTQAMDTPETRKMILRAIDLSEARTQRRSQQ